MHYRLLFDAPAGVDQLLLHFGAVDWRSSVYVNGKHVGDHTGGFDGFSFELSEITPTHNELIVYVFDPSDSGAQPNGKQRISAIDSPGGDTYTPSSGIWQTVWLEAVPTAMHITSLQIATDAVSLTVSAAVSSAAVTPPLPAQLQYDVYEHGSSQRLASADGAAGVAVRISVPRPKLWSPASPYLYDLRVTLSSSCPPSRCQQDKVLAFFGP